MEMKQMLSDKLCESCDRATVLKCSHCESHFCSLDCMIKDNHEHALCARLMKSTNVLPHAKQQRIASIISREKANSSMAYKVMESRLPEDVKQGKRVSVQQRLGEALAKSKNDENISLDVMTTSKSTRGREWYLKLNEIKGTLTYKVMESRLPEDVKQGKRQSVQDRLKRALQKPTVLKIKTDATNNIHKTEDVSNLEKPKVSQVKEANDNIKKRIILPSTYSLPNEIKSQRDFLKVIDDLESIDYEALDDCEVAALEEINLKLQQIDLSKLSP